MARLECIHYDVALKYLHRSFNVPSMVSCKVDGTEDLVEKSEEYGTALDVDYS